MRSEVRRLGRFAGVAAVVGLLWYAITMKLAPLPRPLDEFQTEPQLLVLMCFVLGVLVPAWILRHRVAGTRWTWTLPAAGLGLVLATLCCSTLLFGSVYLGGGSVEEVRMESTLAGKLLWSVLCVVSLAAQGVVLAALNVHVSLPIAWASFVSLRWASGGLEPSRLGTNPPING